MEDCNLFTAKSAESDGQVICYMDAILKVSIGQYSPGDKLAIIAIDSESTPPTLTIYADDLQTEIYQCELNYTIGRELYRKSE